MKITDKEIKENMDFIANPELSKNKNIMGKRIIKINEFLVKHFEDYSAEEKLTVKNVVKKIICGTKDNTKAAQELMKVFLGQIRDEILDCVYDSLGNDNVGQVNKVFNKYLNKK